MHENTGSSRGGRKGWNRNGESNAEIAGSETFQIQLTSKNMWVLAIQELDDGEKYRSHWTTESPIFLA